MSDENIGQSHMPYPTEIKGTTAINYGSGPQATSSSDGNGAFAATDSGETGTPGTPCSRHTWATRWRCMHS